MVYHHIYILTMLGPSSQVACCLFTKMYTSYEFASRLGKYNIKHLTIPMYLPRFGSVLERLIKMVKSCLYKSIGEGRVGYFDLLTELSDVQNTINSRPLAGVLVIQG